ncbi:MAG: SDR family NAD(P)-dependent oxidoreductase [Myxococcota bacterium]|nr:SDR family NAD(P)-dependent oxidoreductase [Myxococcota bacterium]
MDAHRDIALITGASRGIGAACAEAFARAGYDLALLARTASALTEVVGRCEAHGVRALAIPVDVRDEAAVAEAVARCVADLGGLSVVINNAGIYAKGSAETLEPEVFARVMDVNVNGLMHVTRHALPHLVAAGGGAVIQVSSVAGRSSFAGGAAYCASKHAVMGYSEAVFEDVREAGVKVTVICPGFVNTEMVAGRGLIAERMIQPADIAAAALFVARFPTTGCPTEIVIRPQRTPYGSDPS